ncbi:hypothetical protein B0A49_06279 [Cryomyces minteri]|uniref:NmrA-like domain-containing protein n=1 Tax=Cryomyces minteri TaxID=331657 RepID=A0A4U0WZQ8_9PEZI|nr:hypothetical protein B0A49_06279 [Cryomyces minteri]
MARLIVIFGVTGTQGSSVARVFLDEPGWKIRGVTRDPSKPASKALEAKGIEIVRGDLDDPSSLTTAVQGADVIFGNTAFSDAFITMPADVVAQLRPGQTVRQWCYELELRQGENLADAVATVDGLDRFVWSSLSDATKWSKGTYKGIYHFDSKAHVVDYIYKTHPKLAEKMSILQMGVFATNWKWGQAAVPWEKVDGTMKLKVPGSGDIPIPLVVPSDCGYLVRALVQAPPGTNLLAFGDRMLWADYVALWSKTTGVPATFEKTTVAEHAKLSPNGYGEQVGEMYAYFQDFGYDGSDPSVVHVQHLRERGIDVPTTSIKHYIESEDWSQLGTASP